MTSDLTLPRRTPPTGAAAVPQPGGADDANLPGHGAPPAQAHRAGPPNRAAGLDVAGALDDADSPSDVLDLLALGPFVSGREPYARTVYLDHVVPDAVLAPSGAHLVREASEEHCVARLVAGDGWSLLSVHWTQTRRARLTTTAVSAELAERVTREAGHGAVAEPEPTAERVPIGFWYLAQHGPCRLERSIETAPWSRIRGNYPARAAAAVDTLVGRTAETATGRLLLLHGPPGTGKTTMLRTLAHEWRSWCQVDCVLDSELLFGNPAYLLQIALGVDDDEGEERWRLMLLEDCDELIRAEAKSSAGQALSRLLNLTDGLLGQGRKVLVAITTNENLASLHPAVTRPGRSLAHVEIGRLSPAESRNWLARHPSEHADGADDGAAVQLPDRVLRDGATLAELYALASGTSPVSVVDDDPGYGCYL